MKKCSVCNYQLDDFDLTCPRCKITGGAPRSVAVPPIPKKPVIAVGRIGDAGSTFVGSLLGGLAFFIPAVFAAMLTLVFVVTLSAGTSHSFGWTIVAVFGPFWILTIASMVGFIGSAHQKFLPYFGIGAGIAFVVMIVICLTSKNDNQYSLQGLYYIAGVFLSSLTMGASGGVLRIKNGLPAVPAEFFGHAAIGILSFACPVLGILLSMSFARSASAYSTSSIIGTLFGFLMYSLIFLGRATS